jgi:hypothetical protein
MEQADINRHLEAVRRSVESEFPEEGIVLMVCKGNGNISFSANVNSDTMIAYMKTALKFLTEKG